MITSLDDGFGGYLVLALICLIAHESWRWLGLALGRGIDANGPAFLWVKAVSQSLVAALCMRLALFPSGALLAIPFEIRAGAMVAGFAAFMLIRPTLAVGIGTGVVTLVAAKLSIDSGWPATLAQWISTGFWR